MHPVGDRPPNVYWRRRVVTAVLAVVVVALLGWGIGAAVGALRGGEDPTTAPPPTETSEPPADPAETTPASSTVAESTDAESTAQGEGEVPACGEGTAVVATADAASYALGGTAKLGMTITNTGTDPCTLDAGSAALELLVVSGEDRIWSSDDCQEGAESRPSTVEPGEDGMLASSVEWTLVRSADGCVEGLPALKAGTYQLTARAGEITSEPLVLQITG